ncbi:MAG: TIGR01244 family sulfur transferase [Devosia sp.]|nr:TIGR01244 family sulfur transferase [Devosia sp.]
MDYRKLDNSFAVAGQITAPEVVTLAEAGFKTILCARPDHEDPGQPSFAEISQRAEQLGLKAVHIPVSGGVSESAVTRMEKVLRDLPKPIFGYCRSGNRAGLLYSAATRSAH